MAVSKVVYGGDTLIDLTSDTVVADKLLKGYKAHGADGEAITGTCEFDSNTQDATAAAGEILTNKTAYVRGNKITGTMKNNGAISKKISTKSEKITVAQGYHDGSGTVQIDSTEQSKLIPTNIREGVTILGVTGTMTGTEGEVLQEKTVTPTIEGFTVLADTNEGFTCLSAVVVNPIPYSETNNAAGGITVTIA